MQTIQDTLGFIFNYINIFFNYLNHQYNISGLLFIILIIVFFVLIRQYLLVKSLKKKVANIHTIEISEQITNNIKKINQELHDFKIFRSETTVNIDKILKTLKSIPEIKIIRYNPYKDMGVGGDQSFSLSILDKAGNGIILTSLYSREKSRTLIKQITAFIPQQELTLEEKDLLKQSI